MRRLSLAAVALLAGGLAAGCGNGDAAPGDPRGSVPAFAGKLLGPSADYEEVATSQELTHRSDAVVRASPVSVGPGRVESRVPGASYQTVVIEFAVSELLSGDLSQEDTGRVFLEFQVAGGYEYGAAELGASLPVGAPGLLYLTLLPPAHSSFDTVLDEEAGRPAGYPLFAVGPQDFYLQEGSTVVRVMEPEVYQDASLAHFEPDAGVLPEGPVVHD